MHPTAALSPSRAANIDGLSQEKTRQGFKEIIGMLSRQSKAIKGVISLSEELEGRVVRLENGGGASSRRRDCHSAAPPSAFSRCFNSDGERASAE